MAQENSDTDKGHGHEQESPTAQNPGVAFPSPPAPQGADTMAHASPSTGSIMSALSDPSSKGSSPTKGFSMPKFSAKSLPIPMSLDGDTMVGSDNEEDADQDPTGDPINPNHPYKLTPLSSDTPALSKAVPTDPVLAAMESNFAGGRPPKPPRSTSRKASRKLPTAKSRAKSQSKSMKEAIMMGLLADDEPGAKRAKLDGAETEIDPADYLNSAVRLEYPWDSLQLGEDVGSAALNRYLKRQYPDPRQAPQLSAQQMLQIVMSLRPRTVLPPKRSVLHSVVHKKPGDCISLVNTSTIEDEQVSDDAAAYIQSTFRKLSRMYKFMCEQDVGDGEMNRRETDYARERALLDRLRSLENEACDAKIREDAILEHGKRLGLVDPKRVVDIMSGQLVDLPALKNYVPQKKK